MTSGIFRNAAGHSLLGENDCPVILNDDSVIFKGQGCHLNDRKVSFFRGISVILIGERVREGVILR